MNVFNLFWQNKFVVNVVNFAATLLYFQINTLVFPPKKFFSKTEKVAMERQRQLEVRTVIQIYITRFFSRLSDLGPLLHSCYKK